MVYLFNSILRTEFLAATNGFSFVRVAMKNAGDPAQSFIWPYDSKILKSDGKTSSVLTSNVIGRMGSHYDISQRAHFAPENLSNRLPKDVDSLFPSLEDAGLCATVSEIPELYETFDFLPNDGEFLFVGRNTDSNQMFFALADNYRFIASCPATFEGHSDQAHRDIIFYISSVEFARIVDLAMALDATSLKFRFMQPLNSVKPSSYSGICPVVFSLELSDSPFINSVEGIVMPYKLDSTKTNGVIKAYRSMIDCSD